MAGLYEKGKRAGSSSRTAAQRKKDNAGTKDGTLKRGRNGQLNMYDAKTGTWRRAVKSSAATKRTSTASSSSTKKTATSSTEKKRDASMANRKSVTPAKKPSRSATSATVSSAVAKGKAQGPYRSPLSVKGAAGNVGGVVGSVAGMTSSQAKSVLDRAARGAVKITSGQKAALKRIIEGR